MTHKEAPPETSTQTACREFWQKAQPHITRAWGRAKSGAFLAEESSLLHESWQAAQTQHEHDSARATTPLPMSTAPRDGTMLRLLVRFTEHATADAEQAWTIGSNSFDANGDDLWQFAGWCWTHDHFTEGKGEPIAWLPLHDVSTAESLMESARTAEDDQRDFGAGFTVDGVRVDPARVRIFTATPPAAGVPERWQPIDTAPKDGTEVLLRVKLRAGVPGRCLVGHYMPGGHCIEDHPPIDSGWYFWNGCMFDRAAEPIEWMPITTAPEAKPHG